MEYSEGEHVFYPRHGVGEILGVSTQKCAGSSEECLGVHFVQQNMTLHIPVYRLGAVGLRKVMSRQKVSKVFEALKGRARYNTSHSHKERVKHYQKKFDTGDPLELAAVARDLARLSKKQDLTMDEEGLCRNSIDLLSKEISITKKKPSPEMRAEIEDVVFR
jgi:CarD family transcriptional regulator